MRSSSTHIHSLYSYINIRRDELLDPYKLDNTKLIIDGLSISHHLFNLSQHNNSNNPVGGDYRSYSGRVANFFKKLTHHQVDILVVFNGAWESKDGGNIIQKLKRDLEKASDLSTPGKYVSYCATLKDEVFLDVIKNLEIKFLMCTFNANNVIATIAKILNCPVLTADTDFFLSGNECIVFDSATFSAKNCRPKGKKLACKIYRPCKFLKKFCGLNESYLPLLTILLNNENFPVDSFKLKPLGDEMLERHAKIDAALNWLRKHRTLQSAAQEILSLMVSMGKPSESTKKLIEDSINNYLTMSTYMLHHLNNSSSFKIDQEKIVKMKNKFFKFSFSDKNKRTNQNDTLQDDIIKAKFENFVPDWFIKDYQEGKFDTYIISLIEHETYILSYHLEDFSLPSVYEISISLIILIYRLVISCTKAEDINPLQFMIRDKTDIHYKEEVVDKYPLSLGDIRNSDVTARLSVINEALGIDKLESLKDLPEIWRLYIATAVFWFKQKVEPEKNEIHLDALLLAMLFGLIEKKIGSLRDYDSFCERFGSQIIKNGKKSAKKVVVGNFKLTVTQAINIMSEDDAIMAANYLLPMLINQTYSSKGKNCDAKRSELLITPIHIYSQFQCCLEHSKNLNAILNFPYHHLVISRIFNRSLIYNLYVDILQQSTDNINDYVADKLENASSVLRVFKLLKDRVNSLLK